MGEDRNIHQNLQEASHIIQEAQQTAINAQGTDAEELRRAQEKLERAEQELNQARMQGGLEAVENPQFQQASEQLHDTRQNVQDALQQNRDHHSF